MQVEWAGRSIELRSDGSAYDADERALWVADLHLGKDASFRSAGVPVPEGPTQRTLGRLTRAIEACSARRVIVVGDLVHNVASWSDETTAAWRSWREGVAGVEVILVRGNHDRGWSKWPRDLELQVVESGWCSGGVRFCHEPAAQVEAATVSGHLHPGFAVRERSGGRLLAGCFWVQPTQLVLPAYGAFTGFGRIAPQSGDRVVMLVDGSLWELPSAMLAPAR